MRELDRAGLNVFSFDRNRLSFLCLSVGFNDWSSSLLRGWRGDAAFCFRFDACNLQWFFRERVFVSSWRLFILVSAVKPVAILRAVFCTVCSFCKFVLENMGDQTVLAYSSIGLVIALYVATSVSFCLPQELDVKNFNILMDLLADVFTIFVCSLNVSLVSKVTPRIFGCLMVAIV